MKDFEITVSLKDNELVIEGHTARVIGFVNTEEGLLHCIKNYIEMYIEKGETK